MLLSLMMLHNHIRSLALVLPGAVEEPHFGRPAFRVDGKIFAQLSDDASVCLLKLALGTQEWLLSTRPVDSWADSGWGHHGWTHLRWSAFEQAVLEDLIDQSWNAAVRRKASTKGQRQGVARKTR
jgi:hypothetical protein